MSNDSQSPIPIEDAHQDWMKNDPDYAKAVEEMGREEQEFRARLRSVLNKSKLTFSDLNAKMGNKHVKISRLLIAGRPRRDTIIKLASVLDVQPIDL